MAKRTRKSSPFRLPETRITLRPTTAISNRWLRALEPAGNDITASELETPKPNRLFIIAIVITLALFAGLSWRLLQLQVVEASRFEQLANGNRVRESITYAPRGRILDRNGRVLAENTLTFQLTMTPFLVAEDEAEREAGFARIAALSSVTVKQLRATFNEQGVDYPLPLLVVEDLSHKQAIALEQVLPRAVGFSLDEIPTRSYDASAGLAHILGYVGRISESELEDNQALLPVDFIGKAGIEKSYDAVLRGQNGRNTTEVDALSRPVRLLAKQEPSTGSDVYLTIDYDLQKRLHDSIVEQMKKSNTERGSGVAVHPKTGEVLAMVSIPFYDNNDFIGGISQADFDGLNKDPNRPLINRVVQAGYSSGSTIKPLVASTALKHNVVSPETIIVDNGSIAVQTGGAPFIFRGWRPEGLGPMNVRSALAWSSNIYFYTVGGGHGGIGGLGVERLTDAYRDFGLGEQSGIDLPIEFPGRVPDEAWKFEQTGEGWFVGDSYNISIGQGDLLVTPLQLTMANMAISNNGSLLAPRMVRQVDDEIVLERVERRQIDYTPETLQIVREGMRQVLTNGTTCDCTFSSISEKVAGKSGTAQTTSDDSRRPHAWYTAFAPWEDPTIHATVMIEEGSGGSAYSAPAIAELFDEYFN